MRLWHQRLLPYLPRQQLFGQHRECCALRGKGWGRKHATVDYIFNYSLMHLYEYHFLVMCEMSERFKAAIDPMWWIVHYRGRNLPEAKNLSDLGDLFIYHPNSSIPIYNEHDDKYLLECLMNLKAKGAELVNGETIEHMLIELDLKQTSNLKA